MGQKTSSFMGGEEEEEEEREGKSETSRLKPPSCRHE